MSAHNCTLAVYLIANGFRTLDDITRIIDQFTPESILFELMHADFTFDGRLTPPRRELFQWIDARMMAGSG